MFVALAAAVLLQQAAPGQVVWQTPVPAEPAAAEAPAAIPTIPDWARADPYGYERSECSPLVRKAEESMEACQARVRTALAANLGDDLPVGPGHVAAGRANLRDPPPGPAAGRRDLDRGMPARRWQRARRRGAAAPSGRQRLTGQANAAPPGGARRWML